MGSGLERGGTNSAADALAALMAGPLGKGLSKASAAAKAWYAANGDRERAHTTGVWLRKSGHAGVDPVMVVSLDSNLLAMELGTNKELYLTRLAFHGVAVSDIRFTVKRSARAAAGDGRRGAKGNASPRTGAGRDGRGACARELPELTEKEKIDVDKATQNLPDGLRQSVSRAMCASLRRSKSNHTQDT